MKPSRFKLGIIFNFDSSWMGGIIYLLNIIRTLDFLDDSDKPECFVFYRPDLKRFIDQLDYPYLHAIAWDYPPVINGYLKSWFSRKNVFVQDMLDQYQLDALYPMHDFPIRTDSPTRLISWFADLQHRHYPEFFSRTQRMQRTFRMRLMLKNSDFLVVSSEAVAQDFHRFFSPRDDLKIHVYHFVSVLDDFEDLDIVGLRRKYELPESYYMVSNQFHKHKNHKVILEALADLKRQNLSICVAMTGKLPDDPSSAYMIELHRLLDEHELRDQISFLGVIPRAHQLALMRHSRAIIQPSLFEGWSTVIEDARSLQVPVIASSLPVNIEQLGDKGTYFEPHDSDQLADILKTFPQRDLDEQIYAPYQSRMKAAARELMEILSGTTSS